MVRGFRKAKILSWGSIPLPHHNFDTQHFLFFFSSFSYSFFLFPSFFLFFCFLLLIFSTVLRSKNVMFEKNCASGNWKIFLWIRVCGSKQMLKILSYHIFFLLKLSKEKRYDRISNFLSFYEIEMELESMSEEPRKYAEHPLSCSCSYFGQKVSFFNSFFS